MCVCVCIVERQEMPTNQLTTTTIECDLSKGMLAPTSKWIHYGARSALPRSSGSSGSPRRPIVGLSASCAVVLLIQLVLKRGNEPGASGSPSSGCQCCATQIRQAVGGPKQANNVPTASGEMASWCWCPATSRQACRQVQWAPLG